MSQQKPLITLEQAKKVVQLLEAEEVESANEVIRKITLENSEVIFAGIGKLTRQVHDTISTIYLDDRINSLTKTDMPDARSRLEFVISETEKAANSTMDVVEKILPTAQKLNERLVDLMPEWKSLLSQQLEHGEFSQLCLSLNELLIDANNESQKLSASLKEVILAQGYQDLTGQVIKRVIEIVSEVEEHLVQLLATFGDKDCQLSKPILESDTSNNEKAEGPIINPSSRSNVATNQDDVDDLLSSLGF